MSQRIMFDLGDKVTFEDSREGEIILVGVNEEGNTYYLVDFVNSCGKFLAKDLKLVD